MEKIEKTASIVLAPGVATFRAPEETHLALICSPELAEPPDCQIVFALGTLDLDGRHGLDIFFLIVHNHYFFFHPFFLFFHLVGIFDFPDIPAFPALQLTGR
jgi:hypothetical protein